MQTFAVPLAGVVLGARRGVIATLLYLLLGALGAPVFSAFQGGFGMLIGTSGGYLLSFPLVALIAGLAADKFLKRSTNSRNKLNNTDGTNSLNISNSDPISNSSNPAGNPSALSSKIPYVWLALALILGAALNLTLGSLQIAAITQIGLPAAFLAGMTPFIIPELLKIILVLVIAPPLRRAIENQTS